MNPSIPHPMRGEPASQPTAREIEILSLLAQGYTYQEVGRRLYIARATVHFHMKMLYRRLRVKNKAAAITAGMRQGIIS